MTNIGVIQLFLKDSYKKEITGRAWRCSKEIFNPNITNGFL